jgi:hypothetical protein
MEVFDPDPSIHRSLLSMTFFARAEDSFTPTQKHIFERLMKINGPVLNDDFMSSPNSAQARTVAIAVNYLQQKLTAYFKTYPTSARLEIVVVGQIPRQSFYLKLIKNYESEPPASIDRTSYRTPAQTLPESAVLTSPAGAPCIVFLCHSSGDKERVRPLYGKLKAAGFKPWLDEEDLVPGTRWETEIRKAVKQSDIVLVCLSQSSITKEGFIQKEIRIALDIADEKPEDTIYIIPARLEECVLPERLSQWHCVDLFRENGFDRLVKAIRSKSLNT